MYAAANYSNFEQGVALSVEFQSQYANSLYDSMLASYSSKEHSSFCLDALKRLACVAVFPQCPTDLAALSFFPPCKLQCEQAKATCPVYDANKDLSVGLLTASPSSASLLQCSSLPDTDCLLHIPDGFFVLDPTRVSMC
jgi:hypothetical protein